MSTDDLAVQIEEIGRRRLRSLGERDMDLARSLHADIYELRDEQWQVVWSHATRIR